jgi:hypothetical protein
MSEHLRQPNPEQHSNPETSAELLDNIRKELESRAEKHQGETPSIEDLSKKVEQHAVSGKEQVPHHSSERKHHPVLINKQLKDMAYSRSMTRVRKHLSLPSRTLSKAVHSKFLERPSELAEKTIARPSSLLGGAFVSAFGTTILLWLTKRNGYEYNYLAVILLFVGGMALGLCIEAATKTFRKR